MDREKLRFGILAGAALLAGLAFRVWVVHHLAMVTGDSFVYGDIAKNLLRHGIYGLSQGSILAHDFEVSPTLIRLPGYPLFLAACFRIFGMDHYHAVLYMQLAADLITCCLVSALAGQLFGKRATLVVLWLSALCPFTATYVGTALSETLVLTSIALALYSLARWQIAGCGVNRWAWMTGFGLSWSILLRPEQVLFAVAILGAMLWAATVRDRAGIAAATRPVIAAGLCIVLPLLLWTARNWTTLHVFQPLVPKYANDPGEVAPLGFNRWYRTWAVDFSSTEYVYWNYPGDRIDPKWIAQRAFDAGSPSASVGLRDQTTALLADYNAHAGKSQEVNPQIDRRFDELGAERLHDRPLLYYLGLPVSRLINMAFRPRTEMMKVPVDWWQLRVYRLKSVLIACYGALNFAYIALGVAGFFVWRRNRFTATVLQNCPVSYRELAWAMALSIILRSALLLTLDNSEPRYTLEFFPILLVWAGAIFARPRAIAK